MFAPLRKGFGFAVNRQNMIDAFISRLFLARGPSAVLWRIAFVVIYAIKGGFLKWDWKHIFCKAFKRTPFIADSNASATVIMVVAGILVIAPLVHAAPNVVSASFGLPMGGESPSRGFRAYAAATLCFPEPEIPAWDIFDVPTIAFAFPYGFSAVGKAITRQNDKTAEPHAKKISYDSSHIGLHYLINSEDSITKLSMEATP